MTERSDYNVYRMAGLIWDKGPSSWEMIFNCGLIPTHYKYICILALTTEKCRWSLRNKITFIKPNCIC